MGGCRSPPAPRVMQHASLCMMPAYIFSSVRTEGKRFKFDSHHEEYHCESIKAVKLLLQRRGRPRQGLPPW